MLKFMTAGESHGPLLTAIVEGIPAGLPLTEGDFSDDMARRQVGYGVGPRMKKLEKDEVRIVGGVLAGETTGAPIAVLIENNDHARWKGVAVDPMTVPRPGHADLTAAIKYGYRDLRFGLERASARETAARVAIGAICRKLLTQFGVHIGSYVTEIGTVSADLSENSDEYMARFHAAEESQVRCPSPQAAEAMEAEIRAAMEARDTLGGVFEVVALRTPPGLGSHVAWNRRLGARLAEAVMSIHAIKGVEIGHGFANARMRGTRAHDDLYLEDGTLTRRTNHAGGLEGGITTGEPIVVRAAMKPISTTLTPRASVDLAGGEEAETQYERSDYCSVPRAAVVGEAMVGLVLAESLLEKLGGDTIVEMKTRFEQLRRNTLEDLPMRDTPITFWE